MRTVAGAIDGQGRCRHWSGPDDVLAIRLPCCEPFWACRACHDERADHAARTWDLSRSAERAVLCGACGARCTIAAYLDAPGACAACGHPFNPRCRRHHPLYFTATRAP